MMQNPIQSEESTAEEELLNRWTKQFLASGARLREATESYESLGFEVHLKPAQAKDLACSECQPPQPSATLEGWYVIYTRRKQERDSSPTEEDELW